MASDTQRIWQIEQRLDALDIGVHAMRGLLMAHLSQADQEAPGSARRAASVASAVMTRCGLDRLGPLQAALDSIVEDIEQLRHLPAND